MIINIGENTKILELIKEYPFLEDFIMKYNEKFLILSNPVMRHTMGKIATIKMACEVAGVNVKKFIEDIKQAIEINSGSQNSSDQNDKQEILKQIIKDLHSGVPFADVKKRFDELVKDLDATEIAAMEESLIREGLPVPEVQRLCDLHVNVFKDLLNKKPAIDVPDGHPVHTFHKENRALENLITQIQGRLTDLNQQNISELKDLLVMLQNINFHFLRKENQLFPLLEKHEFTGPTQVMWSIHDEIRKGIKDIISLIEGKEIDRIKELLPRLLISIVEMIYKEENILFPAAMRLLSNEEWNNIKEGEKEIGFSFYLPTDYRESDSKTGYELKKEGIINLSTGELTNLQLNILLKTLPIDISFVDENDEVRYYSDTKDRIFPRSPQVIGRKVQRCHPPKSVHIVEKILDAFKSGERDVAEFYIKVGGRDIYIRYFAVRDQNGKYLGTLEVSQDITDIKRLDKEKRLLDWE